MTRIQALPTSLDASGDETSWGYAHIVRVEVVRVGDRMRRNPFWSIPKLARWAILGLDQFNKIYLLGLDTDRVGSIVARARALALADHAFFVEPDAVCLYCGCPTRAGRDYCPPAAANPVTGESGRDCETLDRRRDWRLDYPAAPGPLAPAARRAFWRTLRARNTLGPWGDRDAAEALDAALAAHDNPRQSDGSSPHGAEIAERQGQPPMVAVAALLTIGVLLLSLVCGTVAVMFG